jgi:hypothetical protein
MNRGFVGCSWKTTTRFVFGFALISQKSLTEVNKELTNPISSGTA